jgi:Dolichyl-phosphate-mannose-protein mannosyltransferase
VSPTSPGPREAQNETLPDGLTVGRWRSRDVLVVLFLIGVGVRLLPLWLPFEFSGPDSVTYVEPGQSLARGDGFSLGGEPTAARPPGYPAFLAAVFSLCGQTAFTAVRVAQALLGALVPIGVYLLIVRRLGPRLGLLGAGVAALDPIAIGQSPFLLREVLLLAEVTALLVVLTCGRGMWRWLGAGALLAALTLTHQLYILLGPVLACFELAAARPRARRKVLLLRWFAVGVLVALAVFLWARRNERVTGQLSITMAENAVPARELWLTTIYSNRWLSGDLDTGFQAGAWAEEGRLMTELGLEGTRAELYRRAWENWREHPMRSLGRLLRLNLWYWIEVPGAVRLAGHPQLKAARWLLLAVHWVLLTAAAAGVLALLRAPRGPGPRTSPTWRDQRYLLATLLFFALAPALLYPVPRYLAPARGALVVLAVIGLGASLRSRPARAQPANPQPDQGAAT